MPRNGVWKLAFYHVLPLLNGAISGKKHIWEHYDQPLIIKIIIMLYQSNHKPSIFWWFIPPTHGKFRNRGSSCCAKTGGSPIDKTQRCVPRPPVFSAAKRGPLPPRRNDARTSSEMRSTRRSSSHVRWLSLSNPPFFLGGGIFSIGISRLTTIF